MGKPLDGVMEKLNNAENVTIGDTTQVVPWALTFHTDYAMGTSWTKVTKSSSVLMAKYWNLPDPELFVSGSLKDAGFETVGTIVDGLIDMKPDEQELLDNYSVPEPAKPNAPWVVFMDDMSEVESYKSYSYTYANGGLISTSVRAAKPHECPHCFRPRHMEPLRQAVARMIDRHEFSASYRPDEDTSPIICVGEAEGPHWANSESPVESYYF